MNICSLQAILPPHISHLPSCLHDPPRPRLHCSASRLAARACRLHPAIPPPSARRSIAARCALAANGFDRVTPRGDPAAAEAESGYSLLSCSNGNCPSPPAAATPAAAAAAAATTRSTRWSCQKALIAYLKTRQVNHRGFIGHTHMHAEQAATRVQNRKDETSHVTRSSSSSSSSFRHL
jgi:hypothetical protein